MGHLWRLAGQHDLRPGLVRRLRQALERTGEPGHACGDRVSLQGKVLLAALVPVRAGVFDPDGTDGVTRPEFSAVVRAQAARAAGHRAAALLGLPWRCAGDLRLAGLCAATVSQHGPSETSGLRGSLPGRFPSLLRRERRPPAVAPARPADGAAGPRWTTRAAPARSAHFGGRAPYQCARVARSFRTRR